MGAIERFRGDDAFDSSACCRARSLNCAWLRHRAPADGTYYIVVKGYGDSVGMFSAILTEQADACDEGGLTLTASSATISFNPLGEEGDERPQLMCAATPPATPRGPVAAVVEAV